MAKPVHVVSKLDNAEHTVFLIYEALPSLLASSIRVQTWLISLTYNNLTYARSGTPLHLQSVTLQQQRRVGNRAGLGLRSGY
jgi:hypothetical protein